MRGLSVERIANDSRVTTSTVRSHLKAIFQKLDVNSQVEAVALARLADWTAADASSVIPPSLAAASSRTGTPVPPRPVGEMERKLA